MNQSVQFKKKLLSSWIAALGVVVCVDVSAQEPNEEEVEEVVVTGIRGAQKAAVDVKRNSTIIVDSIVAEDIGKLPDTTIADSLQRISGVQIDRTAGEGSSLNVRGMPQVLTTLNGEEFLSPWSITSVGANYSDIPSSMISGVDVFKSQSASTLAGGISGVIDLKTRRGFDLEEGWTATANIEGSEGSITKDPNHDVNAFVGWNNNDVAFTFGGFSSLTNAANYRMDDSLQYGFVNSNTGSDPYDLNGDGITMGNERYLVPEGYGVKAYVMERERAGAAASFQTNFSEDLVFSADIFYTSMDQYDRGVEAQFNGSNGGKRDVLRPGSIVQQEYTVPATATTPDRVLYSVQVANVHAPDFQTTARSENNHTDAINSNFELAFDNGGPLSGTIRYVHAEAERENVAAIFQQGSPVWLWMDDDGDNVNDNIVVPFDVVVDYRSKYPTFSYTEDLSSVSRLRLYQGFSSGQQQEAGLDVARVDAQYEFEFGPIKSFDFGLRYGVRDVEHNDFVYLTPTGHYPWDYEDPDFRNLAFEDDDPRIWQKYPDWKNVKDSEAVKSRIISYNDFGPFTGFDTGVATLDPHSLDDPLAFANMLYPGTEIFYNPQLSYEVEEAAASVYLQANFESDTGLWGIPYSGNTGVQVVRTDRTVINNIVPQFPTPDQYYGFEEWHRVYKSLGQEIVEVGFTDVLPSFNINFFPKDDVIVRFAYAETMTRNDLRNVGEGLTLWSADYTRYDENGDPIYDTDGDGNIIDITGPDGVPDGIGDRFDTIRGPGGGNDAGNPNIEPWRAKNFNASVEWYFAEGGILGAGVFLIDIESATENFQEQRRYPDEDGVIRREVNVWTTRNAGASDLTGFEIGYKQSFDFLPGLLSGLGTEFNYTYSDSQSAEKDLEGETLPLPSNSKHQYNAVLWYEKDAFSTRIAYNWRSAQYDSRLGLNTNEEPLNLGNWAEESGYLDASINYDLLDNLTVYLQGTNLGETNRRVYSQFDDATKAIYVQERRVAAGIRVRL